MSLFDIVKHDTNNVFNIREDSWDKLIHLQYLRTKYLETQNAFQFQYSVFTVFPTLLKRISVTLTYF